MSRLRDKLGIPDVVCTDGELEVAVHARSVNDQNMVVIDFLDSKIPISTYCEKVGLTEKSFMQLLRLFALDVCTDFKPVVFLGSGRKISAKFYTFLKTHGVLNLLEFVRQKDYIQSCITQLGDRALQSDFDKLSPHAPSNLAGFVIKSKDGRYMGKTGLFWSSICYARLYKTWERAKQDLDQFEDGCVIVEVCLTEVK